MKKDLLKLLDLSKEDITKILNVADQMKYNQKHGLTHNYLAGKTLAMIFEKNSTRTRVSFETGMYLSLIHIFSRETNYSKDKNLWHLSHEGLDLEKPSLEPQYNCLLYTSRCV